MSNGVDGSDSLHDGGFFHPDRNYLIRTRFWVGLQVP